jgi:hypothetical protein
MFDTAKEVGVKPVDIARLLNIHRVTVSLWLNGRAVPHHLILRRVKLLLDAIRVAKDTGQLPLPVETKRKDRYEALVAVLEPILDEQGVALEDLST